MTALAFLLGWLAAGHVLGPLRDIVTAAARRVSGDSLDRRIAPRAATTSCASWPRRFDDMLDRLEAAFTSQRRFVANASHELRTPLTVMRTELEVALADPDAGIEELRAMGAAVVAATERTDALLDSLLLLARSQRGVPQPERVAISDVVRAATGMVSREAADARVDLRVDPGARGDGRRRPAAARAAGRQPAGERHPLQRARRLRRPRGGPPARSSAWTTPAPRCPPTPWAA